MSVEPSGLISSASSPVNRDKPIGNGKNCHQCRQNRDFLAACKNQRNNKPCSIKLCSKCLLNRYGEKAEEVDTFEEWSCPKCRGICNCSVCMKRRGHQPTGILIKTAKATGFSSVSEMLLKSAGSTNQENNGAAITTSLDKEIDFSFRKKGKENSFAGKLVANLPKSVKKNTKNVKGMLNGKTDDTNSVMIINQAPDKRKANQEGNKNIHDKNKQHGILSNCAGSCSWEEKRNKIKRGRLGKINNSKVDIQSENKTRIHVDEKKPKKSRRRGLYENGVGLNHQNADVPLPVGTDLTSVAEVDICGEDIGNALQFLEFCSIFEKILDVKRGEAEYVLEDVLQGQTARRGKSSLTIQFHMRLLSIIQTDRGEKCATLSASYGKNSWFHALKKCFSESQHILKEPGMDSLEKAADYEALSASEKLRVLNFLCDEVLGTVKIRSWIDHQNSQFRERVKEAKQKLRDVKDKDTIVSRSKSESAQAHALVLESEGMLLKSHWKCDAVRMEPIFIDHRGRAYWKLNFYGKSDILHQNVGKGNTLTLDEKWFTLDDEGKEMIEKYISSLRRK